MSGGVIATDNKVQREIGIEPGETLILGNLNGIGVPFGLIGLGSEILTTLYKYGVSTRLDDLREEDRPRYICLGYRIVYQVTS